MFSAVAFNVSLLMTRGRAHSSPVRDQRSRDYSLNAHVPGQQASVVASLSTASSTVALAPDPISEWNKGMKHDPALFTELKDTIYWDTWNLNTETQAKAQGASDVLDSSNVPVDDDAGNYSTSIRNAHFPFS